jgi:hypothetical protein
MDFNARLDRLLGEAERMRRKMSPDERRRYEAEKADWRRSSAAFKAM